jgi:hypothetical protein
VAVGSLVGEAAASVVGLFAALKGKGPRSAVTTVGASVRFEPEHEVSRATSSNSQETRRMESRSPLQGRSLPPGIIPDGSGAVVVYCGYCP